ncbi:MAG TPA: sigma-70 family RNA polymerase sigma factor [Pyrinomonadaceae bacterium]|nr:sigma-70 family RNA polymerase sigma factor [Pyrinomonadaceae bacterium]
MTTSPNKNVSQLLIAWSEGDEAALEQLTPLVYDELHRLARRYMRRESPGHTLQTSALVNEAYLRLVDQRQVHWQNRSHFFGIAAQLMRRILVDHARSHRRAKRGGDAHRLSLDATLIMSKDRFADLLSIDEALSRLSEFDPQKSRIVEMKFFGGLSTDEVADCLHVSSRTIEREWRKAKAWLKGALE